tara:strand:- start:4962 stop:5855 length:894 start_codon:yes stop_codon:yes gene_type:complete
LIIKFILRIKKNLLKLINLIRFYFVSNMNFLVLGDIFPSAMSLLSKELPKIIKKNKIEFVIANGENSAKNGLGITKKIAKQLFKIGIDVITSGNHIWANKEILDYINYENRLIRPANMPDNLPGLGYGIFNIVGKKICVINLMTNLYMPKSNNVFEVAELLSKKFILKKNIDYMIVDIHGEYAAEKMALAHFFDGKATIVFGSHTHIPTSDQMILTNGTAYQTDLGMCGDYNSVIGLKKDIYLNKMLKVKENRKNFPAMGKASICGAIVSTNKKTGLAKKINQLIIGGNLKRQSLKY